MDNKELMALRFSATYDQNAGIINEMVESIRNFTVEVDLDLNKPMDLIRLFANLYAALGQHSNDDQSIQMLIVALIQLSKKENGNV